MRLARVRKLPVIDEDFAASTSRRRGQAELLINGEHFSRIVREGICRAKTSVDILTADFKAMLVPCDPVTRGGGGRRGRNDARSIVEVFRTLAGRGVEIRLLHAGTPSSAALRELKQSLPQNLTIRRC